MLRVINPMTKQPFPNLEQFMSMIPQHIKLWHFSYLFNVLNNPVVFIYGDEDTEYPEEYGQAVQAILDDCVKKLDELHDRVFPDSDAGIYTASGAFEQATRNFVQFKNRPTYSMNKLKSMDLLEWLRCRSDQEIEILKPYISVELLKQIWNP